MRRQPVAPTPKPTRDEALDAVAGILLIGLRRQWEAKQLANASGGRTPPAA